MKEYFKIKSHPVANRSNQIQGMHYRITILTAALIRLEYAEDGVFEDRATQMVWNRDFAEVKYTVKHTEDGLVVRTERLQLVYNEKEFTGNGLSISFLAGEKALYTTWHYGDVVCDLRGTARTLDTVDGDNVTLDTGILSKGGYSVLDDSKGVILREDGWIEARKQNVKDIYFWGYGHNYKKALKDFYYLCGKTPMLPRFVFGNWWSRFYNYSENSYLELMDKFEEKKIPFSVAVIDMDWHLVDIDPKYGTGWTGFTWNRELFPEPKEFLKKLHERGMKVTLNLHPADGIRAYEEAYPVIATHMGVDQEQEEPVQFDVTNQQFVECYYDDVLHPMEKEGVDFWWMDWQQGTHTKIENLDPLWMLNHYDFLDSGRTGKRPLTFSRYSGVGSHRYPIGFSGDTVITWDSLRFQPYFTATASNIGYGWWSHDIGGHMLGYKDNELMIRWVQFAVFSPILRLHSTKSEFHGKEPWRYGAKAERIIVEALRQRHRMVPYLYTMNYRNYAECEQLIQPLYYYYPENEEAYRHENEYFFGSELLVLPVTSKKVSNISRAKENLWLPEGVWYDFFSRRVYRGGKELSVYRDLESIPVFAKAGAIVPLTDNIDNKNISQNPDQLHIYLYLGANGSFELYEDDNESCDYQTGHCVRTLMELQGECGKVSFFRIHPSKGDLHLLPKARNYVLEFAGTCDLRNHCSVFVDGMPMETKQSYDEKKHIFTVYMEAASVNADIRLECDICGVYLENNYAQDVFELLDQAEISYELKEEIYKQVKEQHNTADLLGKLYANEKIDKDIFGAVMELVTAY